MNEGTEIAYTGHMRVKSVDMPSAVTLFQAVFDEDNVMVDFGKMLRLVAKQLETWQY